MAASSTVEYPIAIGYYNSQSLPVARQECLNLMPWIEQTEGTSTRGFLTYGFGIESIVEPINGTGKALFVFRGTLYAIISTILYSIAQDGSYTEIGTLSSTGGMDAIVANNGQTIAILFPGYSLWFYDTTNGLVRCVDPVVQDYESVEGGIQSLCQLNGVFVYHTAGEMFSGSSASVNRGQDFDPLDFVQPFLNDNIVRIIALRNELYVFGENETKVYGPQATGSFPFVEISGAGFDKGLSNRYAVQSFDNSAVFVGSGVNEQANVWRIAGAGGVQKISTPYIDSRISALDPDGQTYSLSAAMSFAVDGHFLCGFTFGSYPVGETYFYDATSSALKGRSIWHRRASPRVYDDAVPSNLDQDSIPWATKFVAECYGQYYTLADFLGVGRISKTIYTEYGDAVTRRFSGYYIEAKQMPLFVDRVEVVVETGVGNEWLSVGTTDRDPQILMRFSDNGGRSFVSMGERGFGQFDEYERRPVWESLGMFPTTRLLEFSSDAAVKQVYHRLLVTAERGYQ